MASLKKSLVFGCAVLLTALLFITGCPSPSSSDIFVPVTDITGVPSGGTAGAEVDLSGATVVPADADYKSISWSVKDAGITGLSAEGIVNARFTPPEPGILVLTAVIPNGMAEGIAYTKDFALTINAIQLPARVSGVSLFAGESMLGVAWSAVSGATSYEVYYSDTATPPASPDQTVTGTVFADITGLTNDTPYNVWIKAKNNLGVSDFSEMESGTPAAPGLSILPGYYKGDYTFSSGWEADDGIGFSADHFYQYDNGSLAVSYSGTIVKDIPPEGGNAGRLIIRITDGGTWGKTVGSYYAVAYKDYGYNTNTESTNIQTSSAYGSDSEKNNGLPTMAQAVTEYTAENSYFGFYALSRRFTDAVPQPNNALTLGALAGAWQGESENYGATFIRIANPLLTWALEYNASVAPHLFAGTIVEITDTAQNSGYIYIKLDYVNTATGDYTSLVAGNYYAIHWKDKDGSGMKLCAAWSNSIAGEAELSNAKSTYTTGNSYFDSDDYVEISF